MDKKLLVSVAMATPFAAFAADAVDTPTGQGWSVDEATSMLKLDVAKEAWSPVGGMETIKYNEEKGLVVGNASTGALSITKLMLASNAENGIFYTFEVGTLYNSVISVGEDGVLVNDKDGRLAVVALDEVRKHMSDYTPATKGDLSKVVKITYKTVNEAEVTEEEEIAIDLGDSTKFEVVMLDLARKEFAVSNLTVTLHFNFEDAFDEFTTVYGNIFTKTVTTTDEETGKETTTSEPVLPAGDVAPKDLKVENLDLPAFNSNVPDAVKPARNTAANNLLDTLKPLSTRRNNVNDSIGHVNPTKGADVIYTAYKWNKLQDYKVENGALKGSDNISVELNALVTPVANFANALQAEKNLRNNMNAVYAKMAETLPSKLTGADKMVDKVPTWDGTGAIDTDQITYVNAVLKNMFNGVNNAITDYTAAYNKAQQSIQAVIPSATLLSDDEIAKCVNDALEAAYDNNNPNKYTFAEVQALINALQKPAEGAQVAAIDVAKAAYADWKYFWVQTQEGTTVITDNALYAANINAKLMGQLALSLSQEGDYYTAYPKNAITGEQKSGNLYGELVAVNSGELDNIFKKNTGYEIPENTFKDKIVIPAPETALSDSKAEATARIAAMNSLCDTFKALITNQNNYWTAALALYSQLNQEYNDVAGYVSTLDATQADKLGIDVVYTDEDETTLDDTKGLGLLQKNQKAYLKAVQALYTHEYGQYLAHELQSFTEENEEGVLTGVTSNDTKLEDRVDAVLEAKEAFNNSLNPENGLPANIALYMKVSSGLYGAMEYINNEAVALGQDKDGDFVDTVFGTTRDNIKASLDAIWSKHPTNESTLLSGLSDQVDNFLDQAEVVFADLNKAKTSIAGLITSLAALKAEIDNTAQQTIDGANVTEAKTTAETAYTNAKDGKFDTDGKLVTKGIAQYQAELNAIFNNATTPQDCLNQSKALNDEFATTDPDVANSADGSGTALNTAIVTATTTYAQAIFKANYTVVSTYKATLDSYVAEGSRYIGAPGMPVAFIVGGNPAALEKFNNGDLTASDAAGYNGYNDELKVIYKAYQEKNKELLGVVKNFDYNNQSQIYLNKAVGRVGGDKSTYYEGTSNDVTTPDPQFDIPGTLNAEIESINRTYPSDENFAQSSLYAAAANIYYGKTVTELQEKVAKLQETETTKYKNYAINITDGAVAYRPTLCEELGINNDGSINDAIPGSVYKQIKDLLEEVRDNNEHWNALASSSSAAVESGNKAIADIEALGDYSKPIQEFKTEILGYIDELIKLNNEIGNDFSEGGLVKDDATSKYYEYAEKISKIQGDIRDAKAKAIGGVDVPGSYFNQLNQANKDMLKASVKAVTGDPNVDVTSLLGDWKTANDLVYSYLYNTGTGAYHDLIESIVNPRNKVQDWYEQLNKLRIATDAYLSNRLDAVETEDGETAVGMLLNAENTAAIFTEGHGLIIPVITNGEMTGYTKPLLNENEIYAAIVSATAGIYEGFDTMMNSEDVVSGDLIYGETADGYHNYLGITAACVDAADGYYKAELKAAEANINDINALMKTATGYAYGSGLAGKYTDNNGQLKRQTFNSIKSAATNLYAYLTDSERYTAEGFITGIKAAFPNLDDIINNTFPEDDAWMLEQYRDFWTFTYQQDVLSINYYAQVENMSESVKDDVLAQIEVADALNAAIHSDTDTIDEKADQLIWNYLSATSEVDGAEVAYLAQYLDKLNEALQKAYDLALGVLQSNWNKAAAADKAFTDAVANARTAFDALATMSTYATAGQVDTLYDLKADVEELENAIAQAKEGKGDLYNSQYFNWGSDYGNYWFQKINDKYVTTYNNLMGFWTIATETTPSVFVQGSIEPAYKTTYNSEWAYDNGDLKAAVERMFSIFATTAKQGILKDSEGNILGDAEIEKYQQQLYGTEPANSDKIYGDKFGGSFYGRLEILKAPKTGYTVEKTWADLRKLEQDMCAYIADLDGMLPDDVMEDYNPTDVPTTAVNNAKAQAEAFVSLVVANINDASSKYGDFANIVTAYLPQTTALTNAIDAEYKKFTEASDAFKLTNASGVAEIIKYLGDEANANSELNTKVAHAIKVAKNNFEVNENYVELTDKFTVYSNAVADAHADAETYGVSAKTAAEYVVLSGDEETLGSLECLKKAIEDWKTQKTLVESVADKDVPTTTPTLDFNSIDYKLTNAQGTTDTYYYATVIDQYVSQTLYNVASKKQSNVVRNADNQADLVRESTANFIDRSGLIEQFLSLKAEASEVQVALVMRSEDEADGDSVKDDFTPDGSWTIEIDENGNAVVVPGGTHTDVTVPANKNTVAEAQEAYEAIMKQLSAIDGNINETAEYGNKYNKYELGNVDLSEDGSVNVVDAMMVLGMVRKATANGITGRTLYQDMITGTPADRVTAFAADCNGDKTINIADFNWIINKYLAGDAPAARFAPRHAKASEAEGNNSVSFVYVGEVDGHDRYAIMLDNESTLLSGQFEVKLPVGARLAGVTSADRTAGHDVTFDEFGETLLVLVYSMDNSPILGNSGAVAYIDVDGAELSLKAAIVGDNKFKSHELMGGTTITDMIIDGANKAKDMIYDAAGRMYNSLQRGINIIRKGDGTTTKEIRK